MAAQSRLDPLPYSFPAMTPSGTPSARYRCDASKTEVTSPSGRCVVYEPSVPGASSLRRRMFAKVPRIITRWFPRRDPYELKSRASTPRSDRNRPAGESALMLPAGEM